MLPKTKRLPVDVNLNTAPVINMPFFLLRYKVNHLEHNRYGFIIGKKIDKTAVGRNRAKRQLRVCLEHLDKLGQIKIGYDMLFLLKAPILGMETKVICAEVVEALIGKSMIQS